jgi:hypothetical protein
VVSILPDRRLRRTGIFTPLIEIEIAVYFYLLGGFLRKSNLAKKHCSLVWALLSVFAWCCSAGLNYLANAGLNDHTVLNVVCDFPKN